ncbi:MAG: hypothetical protein ACRD3O_00815, partial [Terriglobia bacterium]
RLECLAPAADREYVQLQRQEALLDRQLERKIKLLLSLQAADRRNAPNGHDAREPSAAMVEEPLGWLEGRGGSGFPPEEHAARSSTATPGCERGRDTLVARAIALRHKLETPRRYGPSHQEEHEEMVRWIFEVYGIEQPEPEKNRPQVAAATEGGEPACR